MKNLRYEFVLRSLQEGISFRALCGEYGIQPKTGYKWQRRFLEEGAAGLSDRSRRPGSHAAALKEGVICEIVRLKQAHLNWGPRKLREVYARQHPTRKLPSESSFKRVLQKAGLVQKRRRRPSHQSGRLQSRVTSQSPNHIWTVDFKGWWYTREGERCEPLTVRDDFSRYVLCVCVPGNARTETVQREFERLFDKHGLPHTIRSDNGVPFAMTMPPLGLSRLSAWWLALGIDLDRIAPGCPSQNGRHERMHRDIASELEGQIQGNLGQQAAALETWRCEFNQDRPHEALGMRCPAELYHNSQRSYEGTPQRLDYPSQYRQRQVHVTGRIQIDGVAIRLTSALAGWNVGLKAKTPSSFSVHFGRLCLGQVDLRTESFSPVQDPVEATEPAS